MRCFGSGFNTLVLGILVLAAFETGAVESVVRMKDGTELKGVVLSDDGIKVVVKVKVGTMTVNKNEIESVNTPGQDGTVQSDASQDGTAATTAGEEDSSASGEQPGTYKSPFYEYQISKPTRGWIFKKSPPEPLTDVMLYNAKLEGELGVSVLPDENPDNELDEKHLGFFEKATEYKLKEKYTDVKKISSETGTIRGVKSYKVVYNGVSKWDKRSVVFNNLMFKARKRCYSIMTAAPTENFFNAQPEFEAIIKSFDFLEPKEIDDSTYSNFAFLYSVAVPAGWKLEKKPESTSFTAPDGYAEFVIAAKPCYAKDSLVKLADDLETSLRNNLKNYMRVSNQPMNMFGTVVQELRYTDDGPAGPRENKQVILLSDIKLYYVQSRMLSSAAEKYRDVVKSVFDSFAVQRDLTSKTTIDEGFAAIDAYDQGYQYMLKGQYDDAISAYLAAISRFPNFARAMNSIAICYFNRNDTEKGFSYTQKAFNMFPEHAVLRRNLGVAHAHVGVDKVNAGKTREGIHCFELALRFYPDMKGFERNLATAYNNYGVDQMNEGLYTAAAGSFTSALKYDPGNQNLRKNLGICYYNMAVDNANKRQFTQAVTNCERCLKVDSANGSARQLLNELKKITGQ
jgi:tetratricopeptide (TPR) repeat protein